jgi:transposase
LIRNAKQSAFVWGGMGIWGLTDIVYIQGTMDGLLYCDVLKEGVLPYIQKYNLNLEELLLLEDHDSKHTCKVATQWKDRRGINVMEWPGWSPDLNPIENLWSMMKPKVKARNSTSAQELNDSILEVWQELDQEDLMENLIRTMPDRIRKVIEAKGDRIHY